MQVQTVNYAAENVSEILTRSLHETGFAILENYPISNTQVQSIYEKWGDFFASESKHEFLRDLEKQDGYFPFRSENAKGVDLKDLKEFYHVFPWGRVPPELEVETRKLYNDLFNLGLTLLKWLDSTIPSHVRENLSEPLDEMMQGSEQSLLRILHYPPIDGDVEPGAIRAAAHEDINLITLLVAGSEPGLQAQDKAGEWHDISCDPGMITINNGDMLALATGNYFPSTPHRVINPDGKNNNSRFSIPMFLHPRPEVMLNDVLSAEGYLLNRLKEIGLK
ncbi:isopenicillin N synthase family oxygenase [Alphaproteobacteria bacterium]|nr:isopenicillin N synthase family oxygenase [Alphaproteobacteria bacterium]MDC0462419.1 isopenicillin N synthase family oxygenase [Alphaproteobacteria bacterium]MDC3311130.1 isopenicillin N synthase family oxygenase [Alphaproteobacteria bacterium]